MGGKIFHHSASAPNKRRVRSRQLTAPSFQLQPASSPPRCHQNPGTGRSGLQRRDGRSPPPPVRQGPPRSRHQPLPPRSRLQRGPGRTPPYRRPPAARTGEGSTAARPPPPLPAAAPAASAPPPLSAGRGGPRGSRRSRERWAGAVWAGGGQAAAASPCPGLAARPQALRGGQRGPRGRGGELVGANRARFVFIFKPPISKLLKSPERNAATLAFFLRHSLLLERTERGLLSPCVPTRLISLGPRCILQVKSQRSALRSKLDF